MASSVLYQSIELLEQGEGIEPQIVVGAVEEAIAWLRASSTRPRKHGGGAEQGDRRDHGLYFSRRWSADAEQVEDPLNRSRLEEASAAGSGRLRLGSEIRLYRDTSPLGPHCRATGQAGHSSRKVREAERDTVFNEIAHREKESAERGGEADRGSDVIYDLGKAETRCPKREQSRLEAVLNRRTGGVVLLKVDRAAKGTAGSLFRARLRSWCRICSIGSGRESRQHPWVIRAIAREARRAHPNCGSSPRHRCRPRWARAWA